MSLHLGNLSSRIHRNDLEHVFRRFGRCTVQLKGKFGFVVYDFPANAVRALKILHRKKICGELITLSWSNRQPRTSPRGGRPYAPPRGRYTVREDVLSKRLGSNGQRDCRMGFRKMDGEGVRLKSTNLFDEASSYHQDKKYGNLRGNCLDEDGGSEPNFLDNDRWKEQHGDPFNEHEVETGFEFDRYEPSHGDDRRSEDENHLLMQSGGSPVLQKSQEKSGIEETCEEALSQPDSLKSQQTCYICGDLGHKMHNCSQEIAPQRKNIRRFSHRHDDGINFRDKDETGPKRLQSKSLRRRHSNRDAVSKRQHKSDKKSSSSRKHRRFMSRDSSPAAKESHRAKGDKEKKRSRWEDRSPERYQLKKAKVPVSSLANSDYYASISKSSSTSSKSLSRSSSHFRSRSVSHGKHRRSSISNSGSKSRDSRFTGSKSSSRSSKPTPLSLSVSLARCLPSHCNKVQIDRKDDVANSRCPESKDAMDERDKNVEVDAELNSSRHERIISGEENATFVVPFITEEDMNKNAFWKEDDQHDVSRGLYEVKNSSTAPSDKGDITIGSLSPQSLKEMSKCNRISDFPVEEERLTPSKNTESEPAVRSCCGNLTSISTEEVAMALKHYGLEHPKENERGLSVEDYFGSARLWPWEMIYYRRLRKDLISTENYDRRVAQNTEFGIVDRYIRGSSGWGESSENNA